MPYSLVGSHADDFFVVVSEAQEDAQHLGRLAVEAVDQFVRSGVPDEELVAPGRGEPPAVATETEGEEAADLDRLGRSVAVKQLAAPGVPEEDRILIFCPVLVVRQERPIAGEGQL